MEVSLSIKTNDLCEERGMGNTIERKILFMGLQGAGSTQLLYSMKLLRSPDVSFKPSNGT